MDTYYNMVKLLFPNTSSKYTIAASYLLHFKAPLYGIKNNLDVAHFLAQVREEVGPEFKSISENLNYSEESLKKTFKYYRNNPSLANRDGRNSSHSSNQENIANNAYSNRLGNGDFNSGDGWKYRGAGMLQLTGKANYKNAQIRIERYDNNTNIDIIKDGIKTFEDGVISAFAFWVWKDINLKTINADVSTVDSITNIINKYTHSKSSRRNHFQIIKHLV
jgi:putative chitinase